MKNDLKTLSIIRNLILSKAFVTSYNQVSLLQVRRYVARVLEIISYIVGFELDKLVI